MSTAALLRDIHKRFGAVLANRGASLELGAGEIHALVGENGAGKTTLMRILAGMTPADRGELRLAGELVTAWDAPAAIARGVGMVHQHFMLVPTLTVAENVVLGREPRKGPRLDLARAEREVEQISSAYGLAVSPRRKVSALSVGEAQRVEILKTLYRGAKILLLDEPTAVLTPPEVHDLWKVLRKLREGGAAIVIVTHKLDEVLEISERVTVMRAGATVARFETRETTAEEIARAMVGREVGLRVTSAAPAAPGAPVLEIAGLVPVTHRELGKGGVTLSVRAGEILGVAGVEGNGQTELVEAVTGLRPLRSGSVRLVGRDLAGLSPRARAELGLAHVPEDRHGRGLVLDFSVAENLILGRQREFTRLGVLDGAAIDAHAKRLLAELDVRPTDPSLPVRTLSGGNQQKVVVARELSRTYLALVASQPTRGVDIGAIELIHRRILAARDAGKAILLVSAELSEVLALSDRVAVIFRGEIVATMARAEADEERIGRYMAGLTSAMGKIAATPGGGVST